MNGGERPGTGQPGLATSGSERLRTTTLCRADGNLLAANATNGRYRDLESLVGDNRSGDGSGRAQSGCDARAGTHYQFGLEEGLNPRHPGATDLSHDC